MISYTYKKKINKRSRPNITSVMSFDRMLLTYHDPIFPPKEKWIDVEVPSAGLSFALSLNRIKLEKIRELKGRLEAYLK